MKTIKDAIVVALGLFSFLTLATLVVFNIAFVRAIILFIAWWLAPEEFEIEQIVKSWC